LESTSFARLEKLGIFTRFPEISGFACFGVCAETADLFLRPILKHRNVHTMQTQMNAAMTMIMKMVSVLRNNPCGLVSPSSSDRESGDSVVVEAVVTTAPSLSVGDMVGWGAFSEVDGGRTVGEVDG